jgi:hypothetical protein
MAAASNQAKRICKNLWFKPTIMTDRIDYHEPETINMVDARKPILIPSDRKGHHSMKTHRIFFLAVLSICLFSVVAFAFAAQTGKSYQLMAAKESPGASGTAVIGDNEISINAKGLKANSVYTAWFVSMTPKKHETGAGKAPYMFKTDAKGTGAYSAPLGESPFGKWEMLMVVLHPNGNPKDMKNMVGALSPELR